MQQQRHVAIKCVRQQELNALGKREASILRHINDHDVDGASLESICYDISVALSVVRLLETFEEKGHFCLVLELLVTPILNVERWGPWRRAPGSTRAPHQSQPFLKQKTTDIGVWSSKEQGRNQTNRRDAVLCAPPLSLVEVWQVEVHLCVALAFLHDKGLIHADVKPENVVRSGGETPVGTSFSSPPCSSLVKLVDFGNCWDVNELAAYADENGPRGFDVQTVTYRAPEVGAGLLLCSAMDMWSLGCLLLECMSGEPLFTLTALVASGREQTQVKTSENDHLLEQIERVVTNGISLDATCALYQSAALYKERKAVENRNASMGKKRELSTPLQELLHLVAPVDRHFHDFIFRLLDVNPATRATAKSALFHPFLQAYFPFVMVFAQSNVQTTSRDHEENVAVVPSVAIANTKRNAL
ncbi:hypothetical protein PsorP6_004228 [Peronosclerospora sorghi]|uniref:Uncharacterized protein n=1 Tax=Peronosclerospora sorghi TaxID=230839 RepID=A0ACC0VKU6_9STRA|nr:hypothetical protein PsorP6_004228 [Peronosclerospora sorghi]